MSESGPAIEEVHKSQAGDAEALSASENVGRAPIDALVVCGMGPLRLADLKGTERLFPLHPYNRLNALAAKELAVNGVVDSVVTSGTSTGKVREEPLDRIQSLEQSVSEGDLLADIYDRASRGKRANPKGHERAAKIIKVDSAAKTTFDNVIQALNALDQENGGYWEGKLAVLSSEFHVPRIREILTAFGLRNSQILSAERVLNHFGYRGDRFYPKGDFGYGKTYEEFEEEIYNGQPAGLQNLQDNPSYVTFELSKIKSNRRLQEIAGNLRNYYVEKGVVLPDVYARIPQEFDEEFDYDSLRGSFSQIPFSKHEYRRGEFIEGNQAYRILAADVGNQTEVFLKSIPVTSVNTSQAINT